jgi:hypothetical protein
MIIQCALNMATDVARDCGSEEEMAFTDDSSTHKNRDSKSLGLESTQSQSQHPISLLFNNFLVFFPEMIRTMLLQSSPQQPVQQKQCGVMDIPDIVAGGAGTAAAVDGK